MMLFLHIHVMMSYLAIEVLRLLESYLSLLIFIKSHKLYKILALLRIIFKNYLLIGVIKNLAFFTHHIIIRQYIFFEMT